MQKLFLVRCDVALEGVVPVVRQEVVVFNDEVLWRLWHSRGSSHKGLVLQKELEMAPRMEGWTALQTNVVPWSKEGCPYSSLDVEWMVISHVVSHH